MTVKVDEMGTNQKNGQKIALFDFCETLVGFQSADAFVRFALNKTPNTLAKRFYGVIRSIMLRTKAIRIAEKISGDASFSKLLLAKRLRGVKREALEKIAKSYYEEVIVPALIPETVSEMKRLQASGYRVIIVSGGFDVYLRCFCDSFNLEEPVCTRFSYKRDRFVGRFDGLDCMGKSKLLAIKSRLGDLDLKQAESIAFSDSKGDLPMMLACKRGVVVYPRSPLWASENKLGVLRWGD